MKRSDHTTDHNANAEDSPSESGDEPRNPVESLASDVVDSLRGGRKPAVLIDGDSDPESELRELLPVIERLERARMSHQDRPNGLASLGASRPDRLGDFELIRQIGRGGMGVVFEAEQRSLGRRVALKVLPKSLLVDQRQLKRFEREAKTAGGLHHTNIVPVFGVGDDQGFHYFVMQLIEGKGLDRVVLDSEDAKLEPRRVAHLGQQAASALAHAHSQQVLHRDIKPANLIVNNQDDLWVTDFGVAKAIESEAVTKTGDVVGTLRYMAPEQIVGSTDVRSDIYSLGVTLYELLAGRPALDDASIRSAIISRKPAPAPPQLRQLNPDVPRDLETILHTAMSINPESRYASAEAFADDLDRFLRGESISVRRETLPEAGLRWSRQNPALASLAVLTIGLLVGISLLSTVSYLRVQSALRGEKLARANAEDTANLAVGALDKVFDRFSITSTDPDRELQREFASTPALSVETAELLEDLIPYFDSLFSRGDASPTLSESATKARYSIGDIHFQLGHYQKAIDSFETALQGLDSQVDDSPLRIARVRNRIGHAFQMLGNLDAASEQHRRAFDQLSNADSSNASTHRFELARTHFFLGLRVQPGLRSSFMPPRAALNLQQTRRGDLPPLEDDDFRSSPDQQKHLEKAITILRELCDENPKATNYRIALAACLRQSAGDSLSRRSAVDDMREVEALSILRGLYEEHPDDSNVAMELAAALSGITIFELMTRNTHYEGVERCREAVELCELLVAAHPNVPTYNNALVHTLFRLGVLLERMSEREREVRDFEEEASDAFYQAARRQAVLLRQHPDEIGYQAWNAVFLMRYGDITSRFGNLEQCEKALQESAETWLAVCEELPDHQVGWDALPHVYFVLSKVQHRLGKHEAAKASRTEAELHALYREVGPDANQSQPPEG